MENALSIDVEEWHHAQLVRDRLGDAAGDAASCVQQSTLPLLDLLERRGVKATFFIVGEVMRAHPDLVQQISARGHEIDAILCDFHMPRMDGFEATRQIRALAAGRDLPLRILGLTADITTSVKDRARAAGMGDIVIKPF